MSSVSNSIDDQWTGIALGFVPQLSLRAAKPACAGGFVSRPDPRLPGRRKAMTAKNIRH